MAWGGGSVIGGTLPPPSSLVWRIQSPCIAASGSWGQYDLTVGQCPFGPLSSALPVWHVDQQGRPSEGIGRSLYLVWQRFRRLSRSLVHLAWATFDEAAFLGAMPPDIMLRGRSWQPKVCKAWGGWAGLLVAGSRHPDMRDGAGRGLVGTLSLMWLPSSLPHAACRPSTTPRCASDCHAR